jgi:hypothetical protein
MNGNLPISDNNRLVEKKKPGEYPVYIHNIHKGKLCLINITRIDEASFDTTFFNTYDRTSLECYTCCTCMNKKLETMLQLLNFTQIQISQMYVFCSKKCRDIMNFERQMVGEKLQRELLSKLYK